MTLMQYMGIVWLFKHMKPTTSCWRVILSATQFFIYSFLYEYFVLLCVLNGFSFLQFVVEKALAYADVQAEHDAGRKAGK